MQTDAKSWASRTAVGIVGMLLLGAFLVEIPKLAGNNPGPACSSGYPSANPVNSVAPVNASSQVAPQNGTVPALAPAAISFPSTDLALTALADLPISNSSTTTEIENKTFWQQVEAEWTHDVAAIAPQTFVGFVNSSNTWQTWVYQNLPNPPPWLSTGFIPFYRNQVFTLPEANQAQNGSGPIGVENIKEFAASVSGTSLAALDFVSFNGLTALKTYFETDDVSLALCQTFPAQLVTLYTSAFDSSVPSDLRAQYLGRALAITTFMVALAGAKDGFSPEFQTAIDSEGLGKAWPTVRPYLGEIGDKVSGAASEATLSVLRTVAGKFPQDSVWATGLTADRIDSMLQVFKGDGFTDDSIGNDIQKVAQAASSSPHEDGAASEADELSYHDGNWLKASVRSQNRLSLYSDSTGRTEAIKISFLQSNVPGFDPTKANFVQISYQEADVTVYNYYGGPSDTADGADAQDETWTPTAPSDVAQPDTIVTIQFSLLTPERFATRMPQLQFSGFMQDAPWMTFTSQITSYSIGDDGSLRIDITQAPFAGIDLTIFQVEGSNPTLGFDGKVTYLDFQVIDAFGQSTEMRLVYNGYDNPQLRITSGGTNAEFSQVLLISSDGVKLKFLEDTGGGETSEATIYAKPPTSLYQLAQMNQDDSSYLIDGASAVYEIDQVTARSLEYTMVTEGSKYDRGVVGAEIAYTVGTQKLGIQDLILPEAAEGGADLYTPSHTIVIESRMLDLRDTTSDAQIKAAIQSQLVDMASQLENDFDANKGQVRMGYLIISYIDSQMIIHSVIVQVPPS